MPPKSDKNVTLNSAVHTADRRSGSALSRVSKSCTFTRCLVIRPDV